MFRREFIVADTAERAEQHAIRLSKLHARALNGNNYLTVSYVLVPEESIVVRRDMPLGVQVSSCQGHDFIHFVGLGARSGALRVYYEYAKILTDNVYIDFPKSYGRAFVPSLRIAHVFAERLGISSNWRLENQE